VGFVKSITQPFVKGTATIGTWFGIPKSTSEHLAHSLYGTTDPAQVKAQGLIKAALDASNNAVAIDRQRRRVGGALATGAPDPGVGGTALSQAGSAYGKTTLGG
jgi:hypothetical protein